jgi:phenylalanine-4-hydroxylase
VSTIDRVPPHLRQYVVEQDYAQYDAVDQAVWRFVLLQLYARLRDTAHPAYAGGLERTGMSTERIPRLAEMDARLGEFGWGAVCVDGFIPPRAFVEFQAQAILPIAAEIRTREHLPYTPAPDIIHEAAGHAPILPDPHYARFLRRIGAIGQRAFALPEDDGVYRAVRALSEIKEDRLASELEVQATERALEQALALVPAVSEAATIARLYWWTVEYGLVGTPADYRLYGSGLLSSLGESHGCHSPEVKKLPLSAACVEVSYDITRPQPQLFVARDFEQLDEVLDQVSAELSWRVGGLRALLAARASRELGSVELDSGVQIVGVVDGVECAGDHDPAIVSWTGPVAFAYAGRLLGEASQAEQADLVLPLGALAEQPRRAPGERVRIEYASGVRCEGRCAGELIAPDGRVLGIRLTEASLRWGDRLLFRDRARYTLLVAERVTSAWAGAADSSYLLATAFSGASVPRPKRRDARERELCRLYESARGAPLSVLAEVHARLSHDYPDEWLLRWNLLESLGSAGFESELRQQLERELRALELRYRHAQPIATGLRYLGLRAA